MNAGVSVSLMPEYLQYVVSLHLVFRGRDRQIGRGCCRIVLKVNAY